MLNVTRLFRGLATLALLGAMTACAAPAFQAQATSGELVLPIDQENHPDNGR